MYLIRRCHEEEYYRRLSVLTVFPFRTGRDPAGNDATTKPDLYYLKNEQAIDSLKLLPPPPEVGSIQFLNDQAMYEKGRMLRNTERGKQAQADADLAAGGVATAFSGAFGYPITEKDSGAL